MTDLVNITQGHALTMSSLEIAGLTGKRHDHVLRDIRKMLAELGEPFPQIWGKVPSSGGRPLDVAHLPKRECMVLMMGYSVALRARVYDRWQELEAMIAHATPSSVGLVTDLAAEVRAAIGGITKGVVHKELTEIIPALVRSELASSSLVFRRGKTAGQIWRDHDYPRIRVTSWFGNRLAEMGCQIDGGGRGELGVSTARLFDPDKANAWLRNGGDILVRHKITEREGQRKLRLVGGSSTEQSSSMG